MSKPVASYPKKCGDIKNDDYFQWILQNLDGWDNDDRNTVGHNLNK
jgi:hypothetical protein